LEEDEDETLKLIKNIPIETPIPEILLIQDLEPNTMYKFVFIYYLK
jgi:hypothetical protein